MKEGSSERGFWDWLFFKDPIDISTQEKKKTPHRPDMPPKPPRDIYPEDGTIIINPDNANYAFWQDSQSDAKIEFSIIYGSTTSQAKITKFPCALGRLAESAAFVIPDISVSRRHALIEHIGGDFFIVDTNSSNGVYVNDVKIENGERCKISLNDIIYIGRVKLLVLAIE